MRFYVGLHMPNHAQHFARCMVSVNRLRNRRRDFPAREWMMDSGAFTEVTQHGGYRHGVEEYAEQVNRWVRCGDMVAATAQDWMCEPFALKATGKTVAEHQSLTVERYAALLPLTDAYVLPVIQGWHPADYAAHVRQYGALLRHGAWVGVGSVCKRNTEVGAIEAVLRAILTTRPDLRLHGFGLKLTALRDAAVRSLLHSADSMAWSFAARREGRNANDWREAQAFNESVERRPDQHNLFAA
jgi:hypothetical protein